MLGMVGISKASEKDSSITSRTTLGKGGRRGGTGVQLRRDGGAICVASLGGGSSADRFSIL